MLILNNVNVKKDLCGRETNALHDVIKLDKVVNLIQLKNFACANKASNIHFLALDVISNAKTYLLPLTQINRSHLQHVNVIKAINGCKVA